MALRYYALPSQSKPENKVQRSLYLVDGPLAGLTIV